MRVRTNVAATSLILSLAMSAFASQSRQAGTPPSQSAGSLKSTQAGQSTDYVIGPEDVLDIGVWKEPEFSRVVPVRPDGKVSLPLLNDIQAAGLTTTELAASVRDKLKKYVDQPQVTVIVTQTNSQRVYVLGEVMRPGTVSLYPSMTVLQALASAGGLTQFANQKKVYILRSENGKQVKYPFNYKKALQGGLLQQNIALRPGDTIVVP